MRTFTRCVRAFVVGDELFKKGSPTVTLLDGHEKEVLKNGDREVFNAINYAAFGIYRDLGKTPEMKHILQRIIKINK
jgi:hypothetical protein